MTNDSMRDAAKGTADKTTENHVNASPPAPSTGKGDLGGRGFRRILITGGAGFIGSHIANRLHARGDHVIVIDNESTGDRSALNPAINFVKGDVRDYDALTPIFEAGVDAVLHIAGQASIRLSFMDPAEDLKTNTLGTINVLRQCTRFRVPRLIFASSMTIYGNTMFVPTPETAPPAPVSYYAVTKYAAEQYVHITAQRSDLDFDFNVTSFRMFNVYGAGQSLSNSYQGVLAIFIGNVLRGEPITIHSDGVQSRDFVHIDDVVRAWVDAIDNPRTFGQIINLGTGAPTSVNQLCDGILDALGHTRQTYPVSHTDAQPGDMRHSAADISRARELMGWSPRVRLSDGLKRTVAWAQQQYEK